MSGWDMLFQLLTILNTLLSRALELLFLPHADRGTSTSTRLHLIFWFCCCCIWSFDSFATVSLAPTFGSSRGQDVFLLNVWFYNAMSARKYRLLRNIHLEPCTRTALTVGTRYPSLPTSCSQVLLSWTEVVEGRGPQSAELGASVTSNAILIARRSFDILALSPFLVKQEWQMEREKGLQRRDWNQDLLQVRNGKGQLVQRKVYSHLSLFHFRF